MFNKELELAITTAKKAGEILLSHYSSDYDVQKKMDGTFVTSADYASDEHIKSSLKSAFPYSILSEELSSDFNVGDDLFWVVDPLDGTKNFIEKKGEFAVSIGLVKGNEPVLGVLNYPLTSKTYYGVKNGGTSESFNIKSDETSLVYAPVFSQLDEFTHKAGVDNIKHVPGFISKVKVLLSGEANIFVYPIHKDYYFNEWDSCAAQIILREAGLEVSDLYGDSPSYGNQNPAFHKGFIAYRKEVPSETIKTLMSDSFRQFFSL